MPGPRLTPLAESLPATVPFTGPEALERRSGVPLRARLGANESVFGPSPAVIEAMTRAAHDAWMYGDPELHDLKAAIAVRHGVDPGNIVVGLGIDGLLGLTVRLLAGPGDHVVTSDGAYPTFAFHVAGYGATLHRVPYVADLEDPDALSGRARDVGARIVYLANPDNPMGSWHDGATIGRMISNIPDGCVLALDEAYADLAPPDSVARIDPEDPRVIRFRTFSKAHGLAGLRVGYAIAAKTLALAFDKVRDHFGIGRVAQAGALTALKDSAWIGDVRSRVAAARDRIGTIARGNGLMPLPSATNFVTVDCGRDGAFARAVLQGLGRQGVFIRMPGVPPLDRCIRISCGRDSDLDVLEAALPQALQEASRVAAP
jgi:histidinol-phosphate aminotransferase